jgi:multimeric flavodoxin WrbA
VNILILNASPRRNGRMSQLVAAFAEEAGHKNAVRTIFLPDLKVRDCVGCGQCQTLGHCVVRDDIVLVEDAIKWADIVVFASPTHWANVSVHMLRVFERLSGFLMGKTKNGYPVARNAKGKRAIVFVTCGTPWPWSVLFGESEGCISRIKEVCKYSGMKVVRKLVVPGTDKMDGILDKCVLHARNLGKSL